MRMLLFLFLVLSGTTPSSFASEYDILFICTAESGERVKLLGRHTESKKEVLLFSQINSFSSTKWTAIENVKGVRYSSSFSRGYQAVFILNELNNCDYEFTDSLTANRIGEKPSHKVERAIMMSCSDLSKKEIMECAKEDDGLRDTSDYFPERDLFELYEDE